MTLAVTAGRLLAALPAHGVSDKPVSDADQYMKQTQRKLPEHDFSDKTVSELLSLLDSKDPTNRHCAATHLGARYRNPIIPATNWPASRLPPELPIPPQVIPELSTHLQTDEAWKVRMAVLGALGSLRFCTNTTPWLVPALADQDTRIRSFACLVFIELSREYSEPLHPRVVPALIQLLDPKGDIEQIAQAAGIAERLGTNGTACIPALRGLLTRASPKVRHSVERALSKIEAKERGGE